MQSNSDKQDYNPEGAYTLHQAAPPPPPYAVYPQQPIGGANYATTGEPYISQPPIHQPKRTVIVPIRRQVLRNIVVIPITTNLKIFLLLSGFIYCLWGILSISFQIAIIVNSYSTYYHGIWGVIFPILGGIRMMVIGFRSAYPLAQLVRLYAISLIVCAICLALSVVSYIISDRCLSTSTWYCDDNLASNLKIGLVIIFSLIALHTIFNIFYILNEQKKAIRASTSNVIQH